MFRSLIFMAALSGLAGMAVGYLKGQPRWGFWLGVLGGPIGVGIMLMLPVRRRAPDGPRCPRCSKAVGTADKACVHCGNVLVPIHYEVESGATENTSG